MRGCPLLLPWGHYVCPVANVVGLCGAGRSLVFWPRSCCRSCTGDRISSRKLLLLLLGLSRHAEQRELRLQPQLHLLRRNLFLNVLCGCRVPHVLSQSTSQCL